MIPISPGTTTQTTSSSISPASPTRPSRLRGLSYLRNYTSDRLLSRSDAPPLIRSTSSPNTSSFSTPQVNRQDVEQSSPESPIMSRNRASTTTGPTPAVETSTASSSKGEQHPTIRFIPHVEARSSRPSLHFPAISKTLKSSRGIIRVGRYTEREQAHPEDDILPIGFKSKVVSRRHCEFWCDNGQWFVKDVKSSSGTFLNHVRLSSPGAESRPYPVNDGDVVQLGIDFKGGEEVIFRCVKIRIECNRGWQKALNKFNTATHKKLLNSVAGKKRDSDAASVSNHECSICLNPVAPCQCLFVAPCGHVWHYKCIRALLNNSSPNFLCPNCRYVADLDADVEPPIEDLCEESDHGEVHNGQSSSDEALAGASGNDAAQMQSDASAATDSDHADTAPSSGTPLRTPPGFIPIPIRSKAPASTHDMSVSPSTGATAAFALAAGMVADGLLTPRNDVGPFVLDGNAARGSAARDGLQPIDGSIARS